MERKVLISQYATAAAILYGVISLTEFVDVFNHYEDSKTDNDEVRKILTLLTKTEDVEYSCLKGMISGPEFQPDFPEYQEEVSYIRQEQNGKPRYLPEKDEFLRYLNVGYREPEQPYADLRKYILANRLTDKEGFEGVDGDLIDLHELIQSGIEPKELLQYFSDRGYFISDIHKLNEFLQMLVNVYNSTRLYENNGFTPEELFEIDKCGKQTNRQLRKYEARAALILYSPPLFADNITYLILILEKPPYGGFFVVRKPERNMCQTQLSCNQSYDICAIIFLTFEVFLSC